ncbi:hypothetical protein E2C01_055697 [Portunus trituberculatus]|uniref:Uncharacterized protein n=1 Tax=Portunus trituberculatus TaxID=210409 RepID=A0A5B7GVH2_PORTR|nr:hypothetical protein [Portunus trituberculatus]
MKTCIGGKMPTRMLPSTRQSSAPLYPSEGMERGKGRGKERRGKNYRPRSGHNDVPRGSEEGRGEEEKRREGRGELKSHKAWCGPNDAPRATLPATSPRGHLRQAQPPPT